jgi:hypothetical protein
MLRSNFDEQDDAINVLAISSDDSKGRFDTATAYFEELRNGIECDGDKDETRTQLLLSLIVHHSIVQGLWKK